MTTSIEEGAIQAVGRQTAIGAGWLIGWRVVTRSLGIISTLALAHLLVPADFGLVAMATAFSAALDAFSALGLQEALIRLKDSNRGLYDTAFSMQAIRGMLTGTLMAVGAFPASYWFDEPRLAPILFVLASTAALSGMENIGVIEFRRALRFGMEFRLLFVPRICQFVVAISVALALQSYWALVIGIVVSKLGRLIMTYVVHPYRPRFTLQCWRDLIGFSFWTWAAALASLIWERFDPFVLGPVFGAASLGVYLLAAEIAVMPVSELVQPATGALFAGAAAARHRGVDTIEIALSISATLLLVVAPLSIAISATSGYAVSALLGPNWHAAAPLIAIFGWLPLFSPFTFVGTTLLIAAGRVRQNFQVIACAVVVKVSLMCAVAMLHDLRLLAVAALGCAGTEAALYFYYLRSSGMVIDRPQLGSIARMALSGMITVGVLAGSGLGWNAAPVGRGIALAYSGLIGGATVLLFGLIQFALWQICSRPEGPERHLTDVVRPLLRKMFDRLPVSMES